MRLLRWLAPVFVALVFAVAPARAQIPPEQHERNPPAPQYAFISLSTMLVLVILCIPSRKRVAS